jgi:hypothetical protein
MISLETLVMSELLLKGLIAQGDEPGVNRPPGVQGPPGVEAEVQEGDGSDG